MDVKKTLAVTIILLFIGMSGTSSTAVDTVKKYSMPISNSNTLYVGGTGEGNYTKIQDAIDNATDGDTVFVYDDSSPYYENLIINKSISLIGENKGTTIIDGSGANFIILIRLADYVQLRGFTIRNSSRSKINWDHLNGAGIQLLAATFCNISDMIITDTNVGIYLLNYIWSYFTHSNTISRNIFKKNRIAIALDWESGYTTIVNNDFKRNWNGIVIITTNFNTIIENNFLWNFRSVFLRPNIFWPEGDPLDEIDHNKWSGNYWGRPRYLRILFGRARVVYDHASWFVRYIEVDWHPAKEPYDIGGLNE